MKWHVILLSEKFELHILFSVISTPQCIKEILERKKW